MNEIRRIFASQVASAGGYRKDALITLANGKFAAIDYETACPESPDLVMEALLLPGFIDTHIHGGVGRSVMEGTTDALRIIGRHLARHGVTGWLPTTVTASREDTARVLRAVSEWMASAENGRDGAAVFGCHLEGPYINPKRKGAQPEQFILPPGIVDFEAWAGPYRDIIKIVTLAPEIPGALELTRHLAAQNIVVSIGHTDATYDEVSAAIDAGARRVTHCYNAMSQLGSREPGVVGAAFAREELIAELIWDNIHVHPASCQALINAKSTSGVVLISDGIPGAGMPDDYAFSLGDLPVVVKNGAARLPDGTLAGSLLTLDAAFRNAAPHTVAERSRMMSLIPARSLGMGKRLGWIGEGYDANFILLDDAGFVRQTWIGGRKVYDSEEPGGSV